ncbi:TPA: agmatine deiminase family protein [Morganella morganii]
MGRQRTEQMLSHYFGLKTIIRLNGIRNHDITDAHIDFLCTVHNSFNTDGRTYDTN